MENIANQRSLLEQQSYANRRGAALAHATSQGHSSAMLRFLKPRGATGQGWTGISYPNPGQWGIRGGKISFSDSYLNAGGGPAPYGSSGYRGVDFTDDIITFGSVTNNATSESALKDHIYTLDKVAVSHIYYLLNFYMRTSWNDVNEDDPSSSINQLRDFINVQ